MVKLSFLFKDLQNWKQVTKNLTYSAITLMRLLDRQPNLISEA